MKTARRYQCDYCGEWYEEPGQAEKCELKHMKIKGIKETDYPNPVFLHGYPRSIGIEFLNGHVIRYVLKDEHEDFYGSPIGHSGE